MSEKRFFMHGLVMAGKTACFAMLVGALCLANNRHNAHETAKQMSPAAADVRKPLFPVSRQDSVYFIPRNVRVNGDEYYSRSGWTHGSYQRYKNVASVRVVVDTAANTSPAATRFIDKFNETKNQTAYHEVRHGMNWHWIGRTDGVDAVMLAADEYWARVAGKLALDLNMEFPKKGKIALNVNYQISDCRPITLSRVEYDTNARAFKTKYYAIGVDGTTRNVADEVIVAMIDEMSRRFRLYADSKFTISDSLKRNLELSHKQNRDRAVDYDAAMDSMSMFRINGQMVYLPALASSKTQAQLDSFLYQNVPARMEQVARGR